MFEMVIKTLVLAIFGVFLNFLFYVKTFPLEKAIKINRQTAALLNLFAFWAILFATALISRVWHLDSLEFLLATVPALVATLFFYIIPTFKARNSTSEGKFK